MLKRVAIFAVLLSCGSLRATSQPQPNTATGNAVARKPPEKAGPNSGEQPESYWHKVVDPAVFPTWLAAVGTLAACGIGVFTLFKIKEQTDANIVAANAAKHSSDISARTERAWITTDVVFSSDLPDIARQGAPNRSVMVVRLQNVGRSPAEIDRCLVVSILCPKYLALPETPVYGEAEEIFEVNATPGEIIEPGGKRALMCPIKDVERLSDEQKVEIKSGDKLLYCYGRIEYKDISRVQRITQFGYFYYVRRTPSDNRPEAMSRLNSRQYNCAA